MNANETFKRKRHEEDLFEIGTQRGDGSFLKAKKRSSSYNNDTEKASEDNFDCSKDITKLIPAKLIKCALNQLNSKKYLETFAKVTANNKMNGGVYSTLNSANDHKTFSRQEHNQPLNLNQVSKLQSTSRRNLKYEALFSNDNPFNRELNFENPLHNQFAYPVSNSIMDNYANVLNSKKFPYLETEPGKKLKPFVPRNEFDFNEKELYKMYVDCFTEDVMSYLNIPAIKSFEECTDKLNSWNLEKKVKDVLTVKPTNNVSDIVFYNDDEPLILDTKRNSQNYANEREKFKAFSPEWRQKFGTDMIKIVEETRSYMERKKYYLKKFQERRAKKLRNDLQNLSELPLSSAIIKAFNLTKKLVLPELTPEMNSVIDDVLSFCSQNAVVSKNPNYTILYKDIETLVGLNWLNDEIINTYLDLIKNRSKQPDYPSVHVFTSFFYPKLKSSGYSAVKRWTRKDDIFSYDINLVPLHLGMHWCLAVIDHRYKKIQYYDSLNSKEKCTSILLEYLVQEHTDKKKRPFDSTGWILENMENIPQQNNGSDCGMFTLKYAEYVTRNAKINFTQDHMPYFRKKMVYEIVMGQLL